MLLTILCVSTSKITAQSTDRDSLSISPAQVENVYKGLKYATYFKNKLAECNEVANSLNEIIEQQNYELQIALNEVAELNQELKDSNDDLSQKAVEITELINRKTPWYLHPITYFIAGFTTGILILK